MRAIHVLGRIWIGATLFCMVAPDRARAANNNLVTDVAGRVTVEFLFSDAAFVNQLCVASPISACFFSTTATNRARRFVIGTFVAGTSIELTINTSNGDTWSTNSANNSDNADHVIRTQLAAGKWRYDWEDLENLGDADFNDIDVLVRIGGDTDGDGIWDDWETNGVDYEEDGVIDLPIHQAPFNAVVGVKDIFIEIDWMVQDGDNDGDLTDPGDHTHLPPAQMSTIVQAAFRQANTTYPDGACHSAQVNAATGQTDANCGGINIHLDTGALGGGNAVPEQACLTMTGFNSTPPAATTFDTIKAANFSAARRGVFHYALFGEDYAAAGFCRCGTSNNCAGVNQSSCPGSPSCSSGLAELPGNDFIVTLNAGTSAGFLAGTLMHEFGHNLNLQHGGGDSENYKPNYLSVMNYHHQFCGLSTLPAMGSCQGVNGYPGGLYDYSRGQQGALDETMLNENNGVSNGLWNANLGTKWACTAGTVQIGQGGGALNWDCDMNGTENNVSANINPDFDGTQRTLAGYFDWNNLQLEFQTSGNMEDGAHPSSVDEPMEAPTDPGPVYTDEICDGIDNDGDGAADEGFDADGDGVQDCKDNCAPRPNPGQEDFDLNGLGDACDPPFADAGPDIHVILPADTCEAEVTLDASASRDLNGDPLTFTWMEGATTIATGAVVQVTLHGGVHTITLVVGDGTYETTDTVQVTIEDVTAPEIRSVTIDPSCVWPPNHRYVRFELGSEIIVDAVDACDPNPTILIVSATSDQPDDGLGDGSTLNDAVHGADAACVRAERQGGDADGRVYTLGFSASDSSNNTSQASGTIRVVRDQRDHDCERVPADQTHEVCFFAAQPAASSEVEEVEEDVSEVQSLRGAATVAPAGNDPPPAAACSTGGAGQPADLFFLLAGVLGLLTWRRRRLLALAIMSTAIAGCSESCSSAPPVQTNRVGPERINPPDGVHDFQINTTQQLGQSRAAVTALAGGGFAVAFTDASAMAEGGARSEGEDSFGVRARLFDAEANPLGLDFPLGSTIARAQQDPELAALPGGGFVAVWVDESTGVMRIRGRVFDANGVAANEDFAISEDASGSIAHSEPKVTAWPDGHFAVIWQRCDASSGTCGLRLRFYGASSEIAPSGVIALERGMSPAIAAWEDGRALVAWIDRDELAGGGRVRWRVFGATGALLGSDHEAIDRADPEAGQVAVAIGAGGSALLAWRGSDGDTSGIRARMIDAAGEPSGEVFGVNAIETAQQARPSVVASGARFLLAWEDSSASEPDISSRAVRARWVESGRPLGEREVLVNTTVIAAQHEAVAASLAGGRAVVVWTDNSRVGEDRDGSSVRSRLIKQE